MSSPAGLDARRDCPELFLLLMAQHDKGASLQELSAEALHLFDVTRLDANRALVAEVERFRRDTQNESELAAIRREIVRQIRGDPAPSTNSGGDAKKSMPTDHDCPGLAGHVALMISNDNRWSREMVEEQFVGWMKAPPDEYRHELEQLAGTDDVDTRVRIARFVAVSKGVPEDLHDRKQTRVAPIPEFVPFPTDVLPDPIGSAIVAHAAAIGCDPCIVALPMLAGLGAAIGNNRRIRLKLSWSEPSIFWMVAVGQSGLIMKSVGFDAALAPLRKIQSAALKDFKIDLDNYDLRMVEYAVKLADWKKQKPDERGDPPSKPERPTAWRIVVSDVTTEALAAILEENPRGLLVTRDELAGWFRSFDAYKQDRGGDAARWLELHRGGELIIDRKGSEPGKRVITYVPMASVSVVGTIQEEILRASLGFEGFVSGLAARLLLVMPPRRVQKWTEEIVDQALLDRVERVFGRLLGLAPDDKGKPVLVDMEPSAREVWIAFYNEINREIAMAGGALASAMKKLEAYCARFALVIAMVREAALDRDSPTKQLSLVNADDMKAAVRLTRWFLRETERVYLALSDSPDVKAQRDLVDVIRRRGGPITARDLRRVSRRFQTTEGAEAALADLARAGLGHWIDVPSTKQGGRPTRAFLLLDRPPVVDVDETPDVSSTPPGDAGPAT